MKRIIALLAVCCLGAVLRSPKDAGNQSGVPRKLPVKVSAAQMLDTNEIRIISIRIEPFPK